VAPATLGARHGDRRYDPGGDHAQRGAYFPNGFPLLHEALVRLVLPITGAENRAYATGVHVASLVASALERALAS